MEEPAEPESIMRRRVVWYPASVALSAFMAWILITLGNHDGYQHHAAPMPWRIGAAVVFALFQPTSALMASLVRPGHDLPFFAPRTTRQFLATVPWWAVWWFLFAILQGDRIGLALVLFSFGVGVVFAAMYAAVARYRAKPPAEVDEPRATS